jgi:integrase
VAPIGGGTPPAGLDRPRSSVARSLNRAADWATTTVVMPHHLTLAQVKFAVGTAISQQRRLALLRDYLTDQDLPLMDRAAVCLLLVFGQPISRIHRLHRDDVNQDDNTLTIYFGDPPTSVLEPIASLLRQLAAAAPPSGWLLPGRNAGQPITHQTLHCHPRKLGFPINQARISVLRRLVVEVPAPVIAQALGIHQTTATRQVVNAGTTWSRYASGSH